MIKFFRKIRQRLLAENKFRKYLLYAIGEILLVVIGILIALQINNWNEDNKKDILKQEYINALIVDLTKDTIQLNKSLQFNKVRITQISDLLDSIAGGQFTTLEQFLNISRQQNGIIRINNTYNTNSFNLLISSGNIDLFDDELRTELMELNRLQTTERSINEGNVKGVFSLITNANTKYPTSTIPFSLNKTSQLLWKNVQVEDIPRDLTNFLSQERFVVNTYINLMEKVYSQTQSVLNLLQNHND